MNTAPYTPPPLQGSTRLAIEVDGTESDAEIAALKTINPVVVLLNINDGVSRIHASRRVFELIKISGITTPVIHHIRFPPSAVRSVAPPKAAMNCSEKRFWLERSSCLKCICYGLAIDLRPFSSSCHTIRRDELVIKTGSWVGGLLVDGLGDGALLEAPHEDLDFLRTTSFGLLQGSRMRNTKTEYVSCPSCGRTLFNLQVTDGG